MASLSTRPTVYYDIPPGYMEVRDYPPPPGINIGDKVQIVTTNNEVEYSQKIKSFCSFGKLEMLSWLILPFYKRLSVKFCFSTKRKK